MMSEVDVLAQNAVSGEELLRRKPIDFTGQEAYLPDYNEARGFEPAPNYEQQVPQADYEPQEPAEPKQKISERVRGIFGSMFD